MCCTCRHVNHSHVHSSNDHILTNLFISQNTPIILWGRTPDRNSVLFLNHKSQTKRGWVFSQKLNIRIRPDLHNLCTVKNSVILMQHIIHCLNTHGNMHCNTHGNTHCNTHCNTLDGDTPMSHEQTREIFFWVDLQRRTLEDGMECDISFSNTCDLPKRSPGCCTNDSKAASPDTPCVWTCG